jgi:hypothetical protein
LLRNKEAGAQPSRINEDSDELEISLKASRLTTEN